MYVSVIRIGRQYKVENTVYSRSFSKIFDIYRIQLNTDS